MFSGNTSYSCPTEVTWNKTSWGKVLLITQVLEGHGSVCVGRHFSFVGLLSWALYQQCAKSLILSTTDCKRNVFIHCCLKGQLCIFHCRSSSLWSWKSGCEQHFQGMQVGMGLLWSPTLLQASPWRSPASAKAAHTWLWPKRANPTAPGKQKAAS